MDALDSHDVKFRQSVEPGRLEGYRTVTWRRTVIGDAGQAETSDVPYVVVMVDNKQAEELLSNEAAWTAFLQNIPRRLGSISVNLVLVGFERHLVNHSRRQHDAAVRSGQPGTATAAHKTVCLERLLQLHFKYTGVSYRDCADEAQAGEYVVALTAAIAHQAYKGGDDLLGAYTHNAKSAGALRAALDEVSLTSAQTAFAKGLHAMGGVGPKDSCMLAQTFTSLGALMQLFEDESAADACSKIARIVKPGGRQVGPAAAKKLHQFLTCEDPNAVYAQAQ